MGRGREGGGSMGRERGGGVQWGQRKGIDWSGVPCVRPATLCFQIHAAMC